MMTIDESNFITTATTDGDVEMDRTRGSLKPVSSNNVQNFIKTGFGYTVGPAFRINVDEGSCVGPNKLNLSHSTTLTGTSVSPQGAKKDQLGLSAFTKDRPQSPHPALRP